ncbi:helix-turn-helix domain-containing protein [Bacillus paranthracis]|uniref:helix-turn-helix domain-containing protein n=1 Tax=Bacillus paranthracis TaxID=2026186 RepID=UPI002DBB3B57|nr:helix-turn-helix domain-containing protein [Bacillus paranthracis]MEC1628645.1 helix-turn-helix domain-containing protein [Bacillus paranthracis]
MLMLEFIAKQRGIKSIEIASLLNVSPQTIYKWYKKIKPVPSAHLERIAVEWDVEMDVLVQEVSSEIIGDIENVNIVKGLDSLVENTGVFRKNIRIILQPASKPAKENYEKTILNTVSYEVLEKHLTQSQIEELKEIYDGEEPKVWAVTDAQDGGNKAQYKKISVGDLALFYGNSRYYSQMEIAYLAENNTLGQELWGDEGFVNFYFVTNVKSIDVPVELVNKALHPGKFSNLKDYRYSLNRFRVEGVSSSERILDILDVDVSSNLVEYSEKEFKDAVMLDIKGTLDIVSKRASRVEQGYLRKKLFGKKVFSVCACCGEKLPTSMLIASHIKKRSLCNDDEKLNTRIVIPLCKFGCDTLFEEGYIGVNDSGEFVHLENANPLKTTSRVKAYIDSVVGNKCSYWDDQTKGFFKWHVMFHGENK